MIALDVAHVPVLLGPVLEMLDVRADGSYLDGTVGSGGHAGRILELSAPSGRLLGLDRDPSALQRAGRRLERFGDRLMLVHGSFAELDEHAAACGFDLFDGVILDVGFSSDQLGDPQRGMSFLEDGPLDMRLDPTEGPTAEDLVNGWDERDLADLIYRFGEERRSRRIARAIVRARPLHTTTELADVVSRAVGGRKSKIHPATRTFQALRIAVNEELDALTEALPKAIAALVPGGRLVVVSFHSLEDRIVKRALQYGASACVCPPEVPECRCGHVPSLRLLTRRPVTPTPAEIEANPRARSAKMRAAERLDDATSARRER